MRVLITGATGFIGQGIAQELRLRGHELVVVSRDTKKAKSQFALPARFEKWNPSAGPIHENALDGVDAIVHLAGESIGNKRWTAAQKSKILESRVRGTRNLWEGVVRARANGKAQSLKIFISASAIGYYGNRGDEWLSEGTSAGQGFLADVCRRWEQQIFRTDFEEVRQVAIRTGMVLGRGGGALAKLLPVFRAGIGGPIAGGKQWMSWIHLEDLARVYADALEKQAYQGPINGVAPNPVTNLEFSKILGRVLGRPTVLRTPAIAVRLALGEMSEVVLESQRVKAEALEKLGFQFRYLTLQEALQEICQAPPSTTRFSRRPRASTSKTT